MSDIAEKILAAIDAKEWQTRQRLLVSFMYKPERLLEMNDDLRHCAGDREIVAEVMSWKHTYNGNDEWYSCGLSIDPSGFGGTEPGSGCANDDDRGRCTCSLEARQLRILKPLARGYGVTP